MKIVLSALCLILLSFNTTTGLAKSKSDVPQYTVEGLELVENDGKGALVWARPGASLEQYNRIYLVEPHVAFRKNWERDHRSGTMRVSSRDMDRIKGNVRTIFMEVFTEEMKKGGYELATERAEDVLIVKPAIINLDVAAPDIRSSSRSASFVRSAGSMTLYLELYDSVTDDLIVQAMDSKADRDNGHMQWQTGVSNRAAARRLMRPWAQALVEGLNEAHVLVKETEN